MSLILETVPKSFDLKRKIKSIFAKTNITVRTQVDNLDQLGSILEGTVGFKSKNDLNTFSEKGDMEFVEVNGKVNINFLGNFNKNEINIFVNAINSEYQRMLNNNVKKQVQFFQKNENNMQYNKRLEIENEIKQMKLEQQENEKLLLQEEQSLINKEKELENIRKQRLNMENKISNQKRQNIDTNNKLIKLNNDIKLEEERIKKINQGETSHKLLAEEEKLKLLQLQQKIFEKEVNEKRLNEEKSSKKRVLKEKLLKAKKLELKEKYENNSSIGDISDGELDIIEDNSNSIVVSSYLKDKSIIDEVFQNNYLGFSSREDLIEFQNRGNIQLMENRDGTYDFIFSGEYNEDDARRYVDCITEEYALNIQEKTYLKVLEKVKENNMQMESESIDNENSIVLTIKI